MRRRHEPRGWRARMPPGRGGPFRIQIFVQPSSPEFGVNYFWSGRLLARKWGGPFLGYLLRKNLSARERPQDVLYTAEAIARRREISGWMRAMRALARNH